MRRILVSALLGLSCVCLAAQNCDEIKNRCAAGYNQNVQACGNSPDRRAGICRAEAHNKYIECIRAGGCEA
jgi:hypothetical protein